MFLATTRSTTDNHQLYNNANMNDPESGRPRNGVQVKIMENSSRKITTPSLRP